MASKLALRYFNGRGSATQKPPSLEVQERNADKDAEQVRHHKETERVAQMQAEATKAAREIQRQHMEVSYADFMLRLAAKQTELTLKQRNQVQAAQLLRDLETAGPLDQGKLLAIVARNPFGMSDVGVRAIVDKMAGSIAAEQKIKADNEQHQVQLEQTKRAETEQKISEWERANGVTHPRKPDGTPDFVAAGNVMREVAKKRGLTEHQTTTGGVTFTNAGATKAATDKAIPSIDKRLKAEFGVGLSDLNNPTANMRQVDPTKPSKNEQWGTTGGSHYAFDVKDKAGNVSTVTIPVDRFKAYADEYAAAKKSLPPARSITDDEESPFMLAANPATAVIEDAPAPVITPIAEQEPELVIPQTPTPVVAPVVAPTAPASVSDAPAFIRMKLDADGNLVPVK